MLGRSETVSERQARRVQEAEAEARFQELASLKKRLGAAEMREEVVRSELRGNLHVRRCDVLADTRGGGTLAEHARTRASRVWKQGFSLQ